MDKRKKIFIDSNIILDLIENREPFVRNTIKIFQLIENQKIEVYTSPLVFSNIFYITNKKCNRQKAIQSLRLLRNVIHIINVNEKIIDQALNSNMKDFEDAIQFYTAQESSLDFFITRNTKDFTKKGGILVNTPEEFLGFFKF